MAVPPLSFSARVVNPILRVEEATSWDKVFLIWPRKSKIDGKRIWLSAYKKVVTQHVYRQLSVNPVIAEIDYTKSILNVLKG